MPHEGMRQDGYQRWVTNRVLTTAVGFLFFALAALLLGSELSDEGVSMVLKFLMMSAGSVGLIGGGFFVAMALVFRVGMLVKKRPNEKASRIILHVVIVVWILGMLAIFTVLPNMPIRTTLYVLSGFLGTALIGVAALVFMAGMKSNFSREDYEQMLAEQKKKGGDKN